jgi:hypothetical protein
MCCDFGATVLNFLLEAANNSQCHHGALSKHLQARNEHSQYHANGRVDKNTKCCVIESVSIIVSLAQVPWVSCSATMDLLRLIMHIAAVQPMECLIDKSMHEACICILKHISN